MQNQNHPLSPACTFGAEVCAGVGGFLCAEGESESGIFVLDTSTPPLRWSVASAWRGSTIEKRGSCAIIIGTNDAVPSVVEDVDGFGRARSRRTFNGRKERGSDVGILDVGEREPAKGDVWGALINVDCSQDGDSSPAPAVFGVMGLLKLSMGEEVGPSCPGSAFLRLHS